MNKLKDFKAKLIIAGILFVALSVSVFAQKGKPKKEKVADTTFVSEDAQKGKSKKEKVVDTTLVSEENLPPELLTSYKKRYGTATDAVWRFYKDKGQIYVVNCVYRNIPSVVTYTKEGAWIETTEEWEIDRLPSACIKSIELYYQGYQINTVKRRSAENKNNDMFIISIFEKQNIKKKLETIVYLDKSGKYIRAEEPLETDAKEMKADKLAKKQAKEDEKLNREFEKSRQMGVRSVRFTKDELPWTIQQWVTVNYPDYIYKDIAYEEYEEFEEEGEVYQIVIQRDGINQPHATIWFTRDGDFLKLEDNFKKEEPKQEQEVKQEQETKQEQKQEQIVVEEVKVDEVKQEIKQEIVSAFETKYPRAKNVSWEENEDGDWNASYTDQYGQNTATFSNKSNDWVYTKTLVADINRIPSSIRTYIDKNYPKEQIKQGWSVKTSNTKPYYTVEVYSKKTKEYQYLDFWVNGKPKEEEQQKEETVAQEIKLKINPEIITAFETKYPRAKNVSWEENEDGDWDASYTDQYGQNTATFSNKSNDWMYTKTLVADINRIPSSIRAYIDKNYPKEQIKQGWSFKTPNTKPYYTVELYSKKTKEYHYLDFWVNGKLKEE
jgi:outer membrane biosynthesis protein TonB